MFRVRVSDDLELRLLEPSHAATLFSVVERNRSYLRQWLPWLDRSRTAEDTARHIQETFAQHGRREALSAGIWIAEALSGAISIHKIDAANRHASIGYWLDAGCQGRGAMTRVCRAIVNHAFCEFALHRVEIRCATGNHRSCAIPQRLGFQRDGVLREAEWLYDHFVDLVVYGMLEHEWKR